MGEHHIPLECTCGWSFEADTESLAYKRRISHEDICDGEVA